MDALMPAQSGMTAGVGGGPANIPMKKPVVVESFDLLSEELSGLEVMTDDLLIRLMSICNPATIEDNAPHTVEQARPPLDETVTVRKAAMAERIDTLRERVIFLTQRLRAFRDALEI